MQKQRIAPQDLQRKYVDTHFDAKRVGVLSQDAIQTRALVKFARDVSAYSAAKMPENYHLGVAEEIILIPTMNIMATQFFLNPAAYQPGSISHQLLALGNHLAESTQILSQIMTKVGINRAVDVQSTMAMSQPNVMLSSMQTISEQFVFLVVADQATRSAVISRLNNLTVPYMGAPTTETVTHLYGIVGRGKGQIIPTEYIPYMVSIRSMYLTMVEDLIATANAGNLQEYYADIIALLSLYLTYINITENDLVYDTAFPEIHSAGANHTIHSKTVSTFKQLALLFSKTGLIYRSWSIDVAEKLMNELIEFIPGTYDFLKHTQSVVDPVSGMLDIQNSPFDHADKLFAKLEHAKATVKQTLPEVLKPYMQEVIDGFKSQAGLDTLLPTTIRVLSTTNQNGTLVMPALPLLPDIWAQLNALPVEIPGSNLDAAAVSHPVEITYATRREINEFIVNVIFPATEGLYEATMALDRAFKTITSAVGATVGNAIPGVTQELKLERENIVSDVPIPDAENPNNIIYAQLDKVYDWRFVLSPLRVEDDNGRMTQNWSMLPYLYKNLRVKNLFMSYAQTGVFPAVTGMVNQHPVFQNGAHKWSWPNNMRTFPTFMSEAEFSWTPIPFNYTGDTVYGRTTQNGDRIDKFMTGLKKYPNSDWMKWSEYLIQYIRASVSNVTNIAMALAGLGFIYRRNATTGTYAIVSPEMPFIYGVPTIFMVEQNAVNLQSLVNATGTILNTPGNGFNDPMFRRVIYDTHLSTTDLGDIVFVLHDNVPKEEPLSYYAMWLRHGFIIEVPILTSLYVMYRSNLRTAFQNFQAGTAMDQNAAVLPGNLPFNPNSVSLSAPVSVREAYGFSNTIMQVEPGSIVNKSNNAKNYWNKAFRTLNNKEYDAWVADTFQPVLGWSKVITPYPHLWMRYRYSMGLQVEPSTVLSPYASKTYLEKGFVDNLGQMALGRAVTLYDPDIIRLDYDDAQTVETSELYHLDSIGGLDNKNKWKGTAKIGESNDGEQLGTMKIKNSGGAGVHVVEGTDTSHSGVSPANVVDDTIQLVTGESTVEHPAQVRSMPSGQGKKVVSPVQVTDLEKVDPDTKLVDLERDKLLKNGDNFVQTPPQDGQVKNIDDTAVSTNINETALLNKETHIGTGEGDNESDDKKKKDKSKGNDKKKD